MIAACQDVQGRSINWNRLAVTAMVCGFVAACGASSPKVDPKLGVAPSPRVAGSEQVIAGGGGRYMVGKPYKIAGRWYRPKEDANYTKVGLASWYGDAFHGRQTANGEIFDMGALSAAHTTLPLPSYVRVTNLSNNRSIIVRVNDRGPFSKKRVIDVSKRTAEVLDFRHDGTAKVQVDYVGPADVGGSDQTVLLASYQGPDALSSAQNIMIAMAEVPSLPTPRSDADALAAIARQATSEGLPALPAGFAPAPAFESDWDTGTRPIGLVNSYAPLKPQPAHFESRSSARIASSFEAIGTVYR